MLHKETYPKPIQIPPKSGIQIDPNPWKSMEIHANHLVNRMIILERESPRTPGRAQAHTQSASSAKLGMLVGEYRMIDDFQDDRLVKPSKSSC